MKIFIKYLLCCYFIPVTGIAHAYQYMGSCRDYSLNYYLMVECLEQEAATYEQELKSMMDNQKIYQAWLNYIAVDCDFYGSKVIFGNDNLAIYQACRIDLFKRRVAQLNSSYDEHDCKSKHSALSCLESELKKQTQELTNTTQSFNEQYKNSDDYVSAKKIKQMELLWQAFVEAECRFRADVQTKEHNSEIIYTSCLIQNTKNRILLLKRSDDYFSWFPKLS